MDLTPWEYWTKDGQPTAYTAEIVATLEARAGAQPGPSGRQPLLHPRRGGVADARAGAAERARRLETLVPGAGHLVHMPGAHLLARGQYQDAGARERGRDPGDEATIRVASPVPTRAATASTCWPTTRTTSTSCSRRRRCRGRARWRWTAARKLVAASRSGRREVPALEDFRPMPLFALVRFGRWDEMLAEPRPADELQYTTGMWHWARGLAYLRQGTDGAERERWSRSPRRTRCAS